MPPPAIQPAPQPVVPVAATETPLDPALRLLAEARQAYQKVTGLHCLFVKRERVRGVMQPENVMTMRVQARPFSIYMHWARHHLEGQEACYVAGKNNGMMRVHSTGLLGVAGFVSIDPNDPRLANQPAHDHRGRDRQLDRVAISNAGKPRRNWPEPRFALPITNSTVGAASAVEVTHPSSKPGEFYSYRGVIYLDKQTHLPIRSEAYDWPRVRRRSDGDLLECFSYVDLKVNTNLPANAFDY